MKERHKKAAQCSGAFLKRLMEEADVSNLALAMRLNKSLAYIAKLTSGEEAIKVVEFMDVVEALGKNASDAIAELREEYAKLGLLPTVGREPSSAGEV